MDEEMENRLRFIPLFFIWPMEASPDIVAGHANPNVNDAELGIPMPSEPIGPLTYAFPDVARTSDQYPSGPSRPEDRQMSSELHNFSDVWFDILRTYMDVNKRRFLAQCFQVEVSRFVFKSLASTLSGGFAELQAHVLEHVYSLFEMAESLATFPLDRGVLCQALIDSGMHETDAEISFALFMAFSPTLCVRATPQALFLMISVLGSDPAVGR